MRNAERTIGSDRNRSTSPFCMSSVIPIVVVAEAKASVWAKIPGIRNSR